MSENIAVVTDASFDEDVKHCKMIAPVLEEIAKDYDGRLKVAKLNVDENPGTPPKFGIRGIPTLMLFKDGEVAATKVGALSKAQLSDFLDQHIA